MERVIRILMNRDGYSREEAEEICIETKEAMEDAIACGDYSLAEEIFEGDLGLELDYIVGFLL